MANTLGQRIRRARQREGLTQAALAEKIGVAGAGVVANWENGVANPNTANMSKLRAILGIRNLKGSVPPPDAPGLGDEDVISDISSFGQWVREQRLRLQLSVPELAKASSVTPVGIYNIESGKSRNPQHATQERIAKALKQAIPEDVTTQTTEDEQTVVGLGTVEDIADPHDKLSWPKVPGIYVLYDNTQRVIYVGKAKNIAQRLNHHFTQFWFRQPIVQFASYIKVDDARLRHQLEQTMIAFLRSHAVINKLGVRDFDEG
jgi:transcriptional regulator with XRE-family HTH domain